MEFVTSDEPGTPRICPSCGDVTDEQLCKKDGQKTFYLKGVAGRFIEKRKELGPPRHSELVKSSKFGYNLRVDFSLVENLDSLKKDLHLYFEALREVVRPELIVLSRDHRNNWEIFQKVFEQFARESGVDHSLVYGPISTTMADYAGGLVSFLEKKKVLALQVTASHNPPNFNGIKASAGKVKHDVFGTPFEFSQQLSADDVTGSFVDWCTQFEKYEGEVVFDLNNGAAAISMPAIAKRLYPNARLVNDRLLPDFGGLKPEPGWFARWNEFGVTFDGDADRSPFYASTKMIFFSRMLAGALGNDLVDEKKVVADQRTSPILLEYLRSIGVRVILGDVGNVYQARIAAKEDAIWYEENWHSGGYPVKGHRFFWGAAPFAVTYWLDKLRISPEEMLKDIPSFSFTEERFKTGPGFNKRAEDYADSKGLEHAKLFSGGIRVEWEKGHVVLRESNTEIGTVKLLASGVDDASFKKSLELGRELFRAIEGK